MEADTERTVVVFRKWRDGGILALFPKVASMPGHCSSYEHIGQHGAADYQGCVMRTVAAKPAEYADLARELTGRGYNLEIRALYTGGRG